MQKDLFLETGNDEVGLVPAGDTARNGVWMKAVDSFAQHRSRLWAACTH